VYGNIIASSSQKSKYFIGNMNAVEYVEVLFAIIINRTYNA